VGLTFYEKLAMMELEELYPKEIERFDELHDKEKAGSITKEELDELNALDRKLLAEFERIKLHYMLNWPLMSAERKKELRERVRVWEERRRSRADG